MRFLPVLSLLVLLPSSSFFLPAYLNNILDEGQYSPAQLAYAVKTEQPAAWQLKRKQAAYGSKAWLALSEKLALSQGDIAVELARYYQSQAQERRAIFWYRQGIKLASGEARLELAQLYFDSNRILLAKETATENLNLTRLSRSSDAREHALFSLAVRAAAALGDTDYIKQHLPRLKLSDSGQALLGDIDRFGVLTVAAGPVNLREIHQGPKADCSASIQLFATRIEHLHYLEQLIQGVESGPLAPFVCFAPVRYRPIGALGCREAQLNKHGSQEKKRRAITCREEMWHHAASAVNTRFIGVMLPRGGANVHLGILYLDRKDTLDVFTHELSHLLGFVDEYPLPASHNRCSATQQAPFAHNLVVLEEYYRGERDALRAQILKQLPWAAQIRDDTPLLQGEGDRWHLGTPPEYAKQVGVFPAASCDRQKPQAFKPLARRTKLTYYEEDFPDEYLKRLAAEPGAYLMPSFHYNIAQALFHQGQITQAKYWLQQAGLRETLPGRKAKISVGDF